MSKLTQPNIEPEDLREIEDDLSIASQMISMALQLLYRAQASPGIADRLIDALRDIEGERDVLVVDDDAGA